MDLENRANSHSAEQLGNYIGERIKREHPKLVKDMQDVIAELFERHGIKIKPWYVRAYESVRNLVFRY